MASYSYHITDSSQHLGFSNSSVVKILIFGRIMFTYLVKDLKISVFFLLFDLIVFLLQAILIIRAGEPANFLVAPAPYFFFKRLWLLVFFFRWLRLQGAKKKALAPDYWLSLGIFISPQPSKVKNK